MPRTTTTGAMKGGGSTSKVVGAKMSGVKHSGLLATDEKRRSV